MKITIFLVLMLLMPIKSFALDFINKVESEVYEVKGSKESIAKKAKSCMFLLVNNDIPAKPVEVSREIFDYLTGSDNDVTPNEINTDSCGENNGIFVDVNIDEGVVIANNRQSYKDKTHLDNLKSRITFKSKNGKFKIIHNNIKYIQKKSGTGAVGYLPIVKSSGTGWEPAVEALENISKKIANCIIKEEFKDIDW